MPQSHGQEEQPITPTTTLDSSSNRAGTQEGADQSSVRRRNSVLQPEALIALLTSSNAELNEALEGIHRMRGVEDGAAGRETGTRGVRGRITPDTVGRLDREIESVGPSHSAIVLSPTDASALEHLSSAMGDLIAGIPGHTYTAPHEQNTSAAYGSFRPIRIVPSRQRSRSNVETQTSTQSQAFTQGRTAPQRPSREESTFYANMMGRRTVVLSRNDRRPGRSEDVASTTLGRRVAARAALGQTSTDARPQFMRSPFRPVTRDPRLPVALPRNSAGNRSEIVTHVSDSRTTSTDEDTELPRLLFGNITSDDDQDDENSDTETDEDLRLRRRILALSSAANQHEMRLNNTSPSLDTYGSHSRLSSFPAVRGSYDSAHFTNMDVNLPISPFVAAQSTSQTGSQTEENFLLRSPSPSLSDGGGQFREVVETVQSARGTYQIRRHVNARGEDQVHQLRDDLWESSLFVPTAASIPRRSPAVDRRLSESWDSILRNRERLRARNAERVNSNQSASARTRTPVQLPAATSSGPGFLLVPPRPSAISSSSSSSSAATRRRGWARLNADGDEIPTDEEEEIERVRTEQRLRSGDIVLPAPAASTSTMRTRLEYLTPTTRSVFNYGLEDDDAAPNPNIPARVRLSLPATQAHRRVQQLASEAVLEKSSENAGSGDKYFGTDVPYRLSPLPNAPPKHALPTTSSVSSERKYVARQSEFAAR